MLSREENELVTRVGPGTPMGNAMRRYWIPALLSRELAEPDGPPVRVRLLGEDLVAFRDTDGRIGLLDEFCPHRRASLFFGRNEECGLRCVYHGWKFDVDRRLRRHDERAGGARLQAQGPHRRLSDLRARRHRLGLPGPGRAASRRCRNSPGPRRRKPHRHVTKVIEECNWLQALEGGIDTSHAPILHRLLTDSSKRGGIKPSNPFVRGKAPKLVVDVTDYGYRYAGVRPLDGSDDVHIRTYHFIMPFHQIRPSRSESGLDLDAGHIWVPIDDGNCMVYNWSYSPDGPLTEEDKLERGLGNGPLHVDPETFRSKANRSEQLPARPRRAEDRDVHRHRRHQRAGPRAAGKHGPHRRSLEGASRPGRQGDHPGAQAAAPGGQDRGSRPGHPTAPAPATTRCAPTRRCCRAAPTGARS